MNKFYLTTPIYYPNARPHVGSAYTTIVCDVLARYKRMCGYDVAFLTGTDEHGEKLQRAAAEAGKSPSEFVAEKRKLFVELWKKLGLEYTHFVYTDQPDHTTSVQRMLIRARERGYIDKRRYEGRYCVSDERYISDGTDPVNCDICGRPAELISEENYFFKLSAFQDRLLQLYEERPEFVRPDFRRNEVLSFVRSGLRDISVSRKRIKWGIPWPDDPEQVFYVWYDALIAYMTGIGYAQGEDGSEEFRKYWRNQPPESEIVHMVGKDILRFHAVYWPAFIMAAYPDQPEMLPTTVFAHGWIYYEQDKMSKSKGNVVYPEPIVDALNSFGAPGNDALRYYLLRGQRSPQIKKEDVTVIDSNLLGSFGQDTSFSYEDLIRRYNADLANDLGNLANRTVTMLNQYFAGRVPARPTSLTVHEELLQATLIGHRDVYCWHFDRFYLSRAADFVWELVSEVNKYLARLQPWAIASAKSENDESKLASILYTAADVLSSIAVLVSPFMPGSAERLWKQLGGTGSIEDQKFSDLKWQGLKPGTKVGKAEPIFPRLDKAATLAKLDELAEADRKRDQPKEKYKPVESETAKAPETVAATAPAAASASSPVQTPIAVAQAAPATDHKITIDDFAKVELRVGEVLSAEAIPGAKKLLKLRVDIGTEVRQVCAGIAEYYQPEQLVGMKIVLVANLEPRKLRGVESNGMIVAASFGPEGKPVLATFKEDVPNGTKLR